MKKLFYFIFLINLLVSCSSESCKIDFQGNSDSFNKAVEDIQSLNLKMNSKEPYYRVVKSFTEKTSPIESSVFDQIDFVECHEDGTIIFQAPDCDKESDFRNVIYFLAYSPKGELHLKKKRNIGNLKNIEQNWFLGKHIETIAN